ncbi:MAG: InlB B-repeat-containing protein, partial [Dehalococcoidia bacterium]
MLGSLIVVIISLVLAFSPILALPSYSYAEGSSDTGDINGDGEVNILDFILLRLILLGTTSSNGNSDIDGNGKTNFLDSSELIATFFPVVAFPRGSGGGGGGSIPPTTTPTPPPTYTLTYNAGAGGSITGTTPQTVNEGEDGSTVTATPDTNYHFVDWSDGVLTASRTDTNVQADITVTANFAEDGVTTYTLTYNAGAGGSITGTTPQTVDCGSDGDTVTATPDACYSFVDWSDGVLTASRTDTNVTGDITVTANFAIDTFTLTYNAGAGGSITGTTPQTVDCGSDGSAVTATPDTDYHFVDWSDGVLTASRTDTNVQADITVTANFAPDGVTTYTLTYNAGAGGSITGTTPQTVNEGEDGSQVTATPDACYSFVDWSDGVLTASRTDTNVTGDITVTANFAIDTFTLTYNAGAGGSITGTTPQTVDCGSDGSQVTATPDACYHFVDWSDGVLTASRTDTNVQADITVTANFAIDTFTLTVNSSGCCDIITDYGTVSAGGSQTFTDIPCGTVVNISCDDSDLLCFFNSWTGDVADPGSASTTVTVDADKTVTGTCSATATYSLTVNSLGCCPIEVTGSRTDTIPAGGTGIYTGLNALDSVTLTADDSDPCCEFQQWTLNGVPSVINPLIVTGLTGDATANASCITPTYTLTYNAGAGGSITGTTPQTVDCGSDGDTVTATPNACYSF